jgi:hypothetical protein
VTVHKGSPAWSKAALVAMVIAAVPSACTTTTDQEDPVVARAFDQVLRWSDLRQMVPLGLSPEDSAVMAQSHINNWVRKQVVLHKAEENLSPADKDFEAQLRDYRNSLVLFAYEQALVDQKLDTMISEAEVQAYYEANEANFELRDHAVKLRWFRLTAPDRKVVKRVEDLFRSPKEEKRHELEIWLASNGVNIIDRSAAWTYWSDLDAEFPVDLPEPHGSERVFLKSDSTTWFLEILELRPRNSAMPLDLVRRDIRSILLNQRKLQLIERMREDLYREALQNKDVEVH